MVSNELIDFLVDKNVSDEIINKIILYVGRNNLNDSDKKIYMIYDIFAFAGINYEQIEKFLDKNISILSASNSDIIKIAWVINNTNLIDEIFENKSTINGLTQYKRIFMRDFIVKNSVNNFDKIVRKDNSEKIWHKKKTATDFLTCNDYAAYGTKYCLSSSVYLLFKNNVSTDNEFESVLSNYISQSGKYKDVDDYINKQSVMFYNKYLINKSNKSSMRK